MEKVPTTLLQTVLEELVSWLEEVFSHMLELKSSQSLKHCQTSLLQTAAAAQALWGLSRQRADLTRCLRAPGSGAVLHFFLAAVRLLGGIVGMADETVERSRRASVWGVGVRSESEDERETQTDTAIEEAAHLIDAFAAWVSARTARVLTELSRCICLALKSYSSTKASAERQGSRRRSGVRHSQLDRICDSLLDFAGKQLEAVSLRALWENTFKSRGAEGTQLRDAFTGTRLRSASVALCAFLKTPPEFLPLQSQCATAADVLRQSFRLVSLLSRPT